MLALKKRVSIRQQMLTQWRRSWFLNIHYYAAAATNMDMKPWAGMNMMAKLMMPNLITSQDMTPALAVMTPIPWK